MFGRRPNSAQARICVLGFSANRIWLVSRFLFCLGSGRGKCPGEEQIKCPTLHFPEWIVTSLGDDNSVIVPNQALSGASLFLSIHFNEGYAVAWSCSLEIQHTLFWVVIFLLSRTTAFEHKSNSTAGVIQVEENLQESCTLENINVAKIVRYLKSFQMFALAVTISETLKFQIFTLKK